MYYIVYQITNTINRKIYIGCHKTEDVNDSYMGSGIYLKRAQKKYGMEHFKKTILETFTNLDDMFNHEAELVDADFVQRDDTYNIKEGGKNWDLVHAKKGRQITNQILLEKYGEDYQSIVERMGAAARTPESLKQAGLKAAQTMLERYGHYAFAGKLHTNETKRKIGEANKIHQTGKGNSQYGTCWVYSLTKKISKKINKDNLDSYISQGWLKGRKMKF